MQEQSEKTDLQIRLISSIEGADEKALSAMDGANKTGQTPYYPFINPAFLKALETSDCVGGQSGWEPHHLVLEGAEGVLGFMPAYLKSHSQGEYVFDHAWADAFHRAGGNYYPKLQISIPFTPATGPRMLFSGGINRDAGQAAMLNAIKHITAQNGLSSAHITFMEEAELEAAKQEGFLHRTDQQFHFHNRGYASYADFLETLSSRKRKNLKKERAAALENGIMVEWLTGSSITEEALDAFYAFYMDTGSRKWGRPYLNRRFYAEVANNMPDDILLVMAKREGRYIAGAINFIGSDTLYGRNWGCIEDHPFLHFEICYHQAIDFAIERGLKTVEAGAQGDHKLARGYEPVITHSAHFIPHEGFRRAIADYLEHEREDVARFGSILSEHTPFKKSAENN